jgi:hypothetical protein
MQTLIRLIGCLVWSLVWCLAAVSVSGPAQAHRAALVIGNAAYSVKPLANPTNDAAAIANAFKTQLGFDHVTLKTDLTRRQMVEALQTFERQAAGAEVAVVFFAGHGTSLEQIDTYLVPVDAKLAREADLDDEAISLKSVLRRLDGTKGLRLVILDACRNPPFALAGRKRSNSRGLSRVEPEDNTLIAYATKDGSTADDGVGNHSPFTTALLARLATPGIDVSFVFRQVRDDVMAATARQQQPHVYGTLGATPVYLNMASASVPQLGSAPVFVPPAAPAPAAPAVESIAPTGDDLVMAVQTQLRRIGCYAGAPDGKWGDQSKAALRNYLKQAKLNGSDDPTGTILAGLQIAPTKLCPVSCDPDENLVNGRCVTKPEPERPVAAAPKPVKPEPVVAKPAKPESAPAPARPVATGGGARGFGGNCAGWMFNGSSCTDGGGRFCRQTQGGRKCE